MTHPNIRRDIAERYRDELPDEVRSEIEGRGVPSTIIERQLLGWNGERVTIPVFGRDRNEVLGFRYAKLAPDPTGVPETLSDLTLGTELYGWETLMRKPQRVVICDGEFERLVLEAKGFAAVTSTAGAGTFQRAWLPYFAPVKDVYLCFPRNLAGVAAATKLRQFLPCARTVTLPPDVGESGRVTDFFVGLGRKALDFELLLTAAAGVATDADPVPNVRVFQPHHKSVKHRADRLRRTVHLYELIANYTDLQASGKHPVGHCPFHDDHALSLAVYPNANIYQCTFCGAEGDILRFVMDKESMTGGQAIEALERFEITHEIYGTS